MQRIVVASTEQRTAEKTKKPYYIVKDEKGDWYSTYDESVMKLEAGDTIEVEVDIVKKGNSTYRNVMEYKLIKAEAAPKAEAKTEAKPEPKPVMVKSTNESIETQVCLKAAVEFLKDRPDVTGARIINLTKELYNGIFKG